MGKGRKKQPAKKRSSEQLSAAAKYVIEWACLPKRECSSSSKQSDSEPESGEWLAGLKGARGIPGGKVSIVDLHTHSNCSDGTLSPAELVEKAYLNGVQVLALTDHDTMVGVPAALEAAQRHGIRLIPGVEISAKYGGRMRSGLEEPVHILGYYSCCGPARWLELENSLARIREGRYHRAQAMIAKLRALRKPIKWEQVLAIAGIGVAPGRVHLARAMVEAGHVDNVREAFNKYLHDGGPAYAMGYELAAEDAVQLICNTGGVAAVAHPWALKDPLSVVKRLKAAGLHAMEVYRSDGKVTAFTALADAYQLIKLGGSDFHGRNEPDETGLGKVPLPVLAVHEFLKVAEPIWCDAIRDILQVFAEETFEIRLGEVVGQNNFTRNSERFKGDLSLGYSIKGGVHTPFLRLPYWLTEEEGLVVKEAVTQLKLSQKYLHEEGKVIIVVSR